MCNLQVRCSLDTNVQVGRCCCRHGKAMLGSIISAMAMRNCMALRSAVTMHLLNQLRMSVAFSHKVLLSRIASPCQASPRLLDRTLFLLRQSGTIQTVSAGDISNRQRPLYYNRLCGRRLCCNTQTVTAYSAAHCMLHRLVRNLPPVCLKIAASDTRMSQRGSGVVKTAIRQQHTEPTTSAVASSDWLGLSGQLRRSSRPRTIAAAHNNASQPRSRTVLPNCETVKQEEQAETAELVSSAQPAEIPRTKKRKQPEVDRVKPDADAQFMPVPPASGVDRKQPVAPLHAAEAAHGTTKPLAKAANKVKTEPAASPAADTAPDRALGIEAGITESVTGPAKSPQKQKLPAQAVIKSETIAVIQSTDAAASGQQPAPASEAILPLADTPGKPGKGRKPRSNKAAVKEETVTLTEPAEDPAVPDGQAKKSRPRKPRAKKTLTVEQLLESVDVVPYRERTVPKKWVGAHVSMGGGLERAVVRAASIGQSPTCTSCTAAFLMCLRCKEQSYHSSCL